MVKVRKTRARLATSLKTRALQRLYINAASISATLGAYAPGVKIDAWMRFNVNWLRRGPHEDDAQRIPSHPGACSMLPLITVSTFTAFVDLGLQVPKGYSHAPAGRINCLK